MNRKIAVVLVFLTVAILGFPQAPAVQNSLFSLSIAPVFALPISEKDFYGNGYGVAISGQYAMPFLPILNVRGGFDYTSRIVSGSEKLDLINLTGGAGISWMMVPKLRLNAFGEAGYYIYMPSNDSIATNPVVGGSAGISYQLLPTLSIGMQGKYRKFLGFSFYDDFALLADLTIHFRSRGAIAPMQDAADIEFVNDLAVDDLELTEVFPVFYKYYNDNPVGSAIIRNEGEEAVKDITLSFYTNDFMDAPSVIEVTDQLGPGEEKEVYLYALFNENIMSVTEGTKVLVTLTLEATGAERSASRDFSKQIRIHDRNAITWSDDNRVGAFVTARNPEVQRFSRNVVGVIGDSVSKQIDNHFLLAMGIHQALKASDIRYVVDPTSPYKKLSADDLSIDYLQFPQQTLEYKAGDCDDLSILYSALLEAIGIETAFITVPGHIYIAFLLQKDPRQVRSQFYESRDDLIFINDQNEVWAPLEVTFIDRSFLEAWGEGGRQWREYSSKNQAQLFRTRQTWQTYEPVGFADAHTITLPIAYEVLKDYLDEFIKFIDQQLLPRKEQLERDIVRTNNSPGAVNKLGVLYARYGRYEEAEQYFNRVIQDHEYVPALINMGNLHYIRNSLELALSYYQRAAVQNPKDPNVVLGIARINHSMEDYNAARKTYNELKQLNPSLAEQFAYLGDATSSQARAAEADSLREVVIWEE